MLILNPQLVRFGSATWENIAAIGIDRLPQRLVEVFGDLGPFPTFADVPEQRVRIRIVQSPARQGTAPAPGDQAQLSFHTSPTAGDSGPRRRISMTAVVLSVEHEISLKRGATRTIVLAAISSTGASDPIVMTNL
jgi:hypothetical protein